MGKHAPGDVSATRRDHLWVLFVIAAFALFDVWESWTQVGDRSGFAHGTGWTLTVIVEAYAGYALFAWFAAPGVRSRRFAMWSAFTVLGFSLIGQGSSSVAAHSAPPLAVAVFVKDLPVVVLALIAVLIHFRRLDRSEAEEAAGLAAADALRIAEEAAAADERASLRAKLTALSEAMQAAQADLAAAQNEAVQAAQKNEILARKLDAATRAKKRANPAGDRGANARAKQMTKDVDARTKALSVLAAEPGISGAALGPRVGMSKRWGQIHRDELVAMAADVEESRP